MNEVEEMRDAIERVEQNLDRFRWIITHPIRAAMALNSTTNDMSAPDALKVVKAIDDARNSG